MTRKTLEQTIRELERQIGRTERADQIYATRRLRQMIAAVEPRRVSADFTVAADDDTMFDNMPV